MATVNEAGLFDEAPLLGRARAGDVRAFSDLVVKYERKIYRLAKHITQNDEDAEDVLQETFLKAYEHLGEFQGNSKFYTWIVRIAVNESLMKLRKRKSDRTVSMDESIDTGEETVVREIAVWEDDPEKQYSRDEIRAILDEADLVHIAEEIEDLSKSRQRALQSGVTQIILRLLKYDMQPARRTRSWLMSIAKPSRMIRIRTPQSRPGFHIPSSRSSTPLPKK